MPKYNVREQNPDRFNRVYAEQTELWQAFRSSSVAMRLCPYCDWKISLLYPGYHAPEATKCPHCGEVIIFPALKLSRTITG